ncbi:MAG: hypF2 [Gammaproteobacteria bacterium]|nr:hypF2 [Gammaproteobacteria bacterium]
MSLSAKTVPAVVWTSQMVRLRVSLRGAVQGVGFRPFLYRLAAELGLAGWVKNCSSGW